MSPNRAWYSGRNVVITTKRSRNGDNFAISEGGVSYFQDALKANRIATCTIRLIDGLDDVVVAEASLGSVLAELEAAPVHVGPHNTFWWVNSDFNVVARSNRRTPEWLV